ncbi:MAG: GGDEF domain-containing phosphodiesterase, partial [Pseudomonadota bacterium]
GVTLFPQDDCDPEQLLKNADLALYQAKANGRGTFSFFTPSMQDDIAQRRELAEALQAAIAEDQLKAFIQPIFSLRDGSLTGAECLIRWLHPERGVVPASEFIPVAEEFLMAAQVDRIILDQVLARLARWRRMGLEAPSLAVNVSPRQIRNESFASNLVEELDAAGLARDAIRIEIFESVLVDRGADAAAQTIRDMDRLGVNVVLDDFGTGYASLTHLLDMPVEALKIHRSFIRRLGEDPAADKIVSAVVSLAQSLGVATIAEGVETPEQFAYLQMRRCDQAQGFLLDAPMDLDSFEDLLTRGALALNVAAPGPRADAASNKAFAF